MLELRGLSKHFGGVRAVDNLELDVKEGEVFGLIGPNGSGKSTAVNLVCGLFAPTGGRIVFAGRDITRLAPHARLSLGVARTFQNIRLFNSLTVWQNLWVAQNSARQQRAGNRVRRWLGGWRRARNEIAAMLDFSGLAEKCDELAGNLSFGEQRRLEVARALAAEPRLMLLDEPAAGMNAGEMADLDERIRALSARGITIVLIEHHVALVMALCHRVAVLNFGQKIAEGLPDEIQHDRLVREAYLGTAAAGGAA